MIDILDIRKAIWDGKLQVKIVRKNIILCDVQTGEAVKIGEVMKKKINISYQCESCNRGDCYGCPIYEEWIRSIYG